MKNERLKPYTRISYEVHVSEDGKQWSRYGSPLEHSPIGMEQALQFQRAAQKSNRWVRLVHITKQVKPLKVIENTGILSRQQIDTLLAAGQEAIKDVAGAKCNEGCAIGFGSSSIIHGPTTVTISINTTAILGRRPGVTKDPLSPEGIEEREAREKWDKESKRVRQAKLQECFDKLKALNISGTWQGDEIVLRP